MNLDPRIIEGKRVLTPFDITEAKEFSGKTGYFSNVTDDFKHLENAAYGVLDLTFGENPYRFIKSEEECTSGCRYFLPEEWVRKEFNDELIKDYCLRTKRDLIRACGRQQLLFNAVCDHMRDPYYKDRTWLMRDLLRKTYREFKEFMKDLGYDEEK